MNFSRHVTHRTTTPMIPIHLLPPSLEHDCPVSLCCWTCVTHRFENMRTIMSIMTSVYKGAVPIIMYRDGVIPTPQYSVMKTLPLCSGGYWLERWCAAWHARDSPQGPECRAPRTSSGQTADHHFLLDSIPQPVCLSKAGL